MNGRVLCSKPVSQIIYIYFKYIFWHRWQQVILINNHFSFKFFLFIILLQFRKRKRRDDKHRRLSHNQSQDTSLGKSSKYGNGIDPRMEHPPSLPKVGSNGLWMGGNPSMYAPGKPYYNDNRRPQNSMMRATSEDRLSPRKSANMKR